MAATSLLLASGYVAACSSGSTSPNSQAVGSSSSGGASSGGSGSSGGNTSSGGGTGSSGGSSSSSTSSGSGSGGGSGSSSGSDAGPAPTGTCGATGTDWNGFGGNICNTNSSSTSSINASNASKLAMKWKYTAAGDVPATPAVVGGYVYVGDEGGNMTKLDASNGTMVWQKSVASLVSGNNPLNSITFAGAWSRTTPIVTSDSVIFATMLPGSSEVMFGAKAAYVVSVSPADGSVNWVSQVLDSNPATDIQQSPVYDGKNIYIGTTSSEEAGSSYTFRGSVVAMDASKGGMGKVLWQTYMIDASLSGYAGGSVWGSTPVVDKKRNQLYVGTGNNYVTNGTPMVKGNNVDSIVALDLDTGEIKWADNFAPGGSDVWTFSNNAAADGDFGSGPNFFTVSINGTMTDIVGAGQKSGWYYALNPDTGAVVWKTQFGPGGHVGGIHWGTATDGERVYAGVNNTPGKSWMLAGGATTTNGAWGAMDAATGKILWQTANPNTGMSSNVGGGGQVSVNGPVRVTNGVLFGGAMDSAGTMYAFDASTGKILWSFKSGGSVYGGPAISGNSIYWGSGYTSSLGFGTSSRTLYAFSVP